MADITFEGFEFNVSGSANWYVQSVTYNTPPDALQGGDINDSQETRIDMVNPGTGDLSFYRKVSSESNYDYLRFYINGIQQEQISGEVDWAQKTYAIDAGDTIYWRYTKDGSVSRGSDTGWLDTFVFTAASSSSTSFSSSSVSFSSSSRSSSSSSSSVSVTPTITTTVNYPLVTVAFPFLLSGPGGTGIGSSGNGKWNYRSTTTGSSNTGPSVPPPGPDIYYWYTETSSTSLGAVFIMQLELNLDSRRYNYLIDFYYSNYGSSGGGECLVQYHNGVSWVTVQTIGWNTFYPGPWIAATQIDLSSFNNEYGQLRFHFTSGGSTSYANDFGLDDITITTETASSSSSSLSSSSSSLSSSSSSTSSSSLSSSSSSSSSSVSLSSGTWTWGQQTGVTTDYVLTFSNGRITPWLADEIKGSGDGEYIVANSDGSYIWSEPAYIGINSNVHFNYNEYAGTRDDSRFGAILFRTGATRQACISTSWQNYDRSVPMNSLGWIQISFTINSLSSSSVSSSSSSSASLNCEWLSYNGGLSDWDIAQDEGVDLATWTGFVWASVIHHLDYDIGGSEYGAAEYIYLVPKTWSINYRPIWARVTHNRRISDLSGPNPRLQILAADSSIILDEDQYISDTVVPMSGLSGDMALFKFYHTGATPMEISNIEFCKSSSSLSSSSSTSSSSSSSSSSCVPTWIETKGTTYWPSYDGVWDGYGYTAVSNGDWTVGLLPGAGPLSGTQPFRINITLNNYAGWDPNGFSIVIEDTNSNEVYNSGVFDLDGDTVPTTKSITPTWGAFPLYFIRIEGGDDKFYVTSVKVYDDCNTGSFSSSSSSSSVSSSSTSSSSFSAAIEDMTTYSLFQTGPSYLSTNTWPGPISRCTWSGITVGSESVCYGNKAGSPFVGNFRVDFEFSMSQHVNIANNDTLMLCCATETPGTYTEQVAANDGIMYLIYSGPVQECSVRLTCGINANSSIFPISAGALPVGTIYARMTRVGTTAYAYAYSDAARTVLIGSTSIVVPTTTFDWFVPVASIEGIGGYWTTGLAQQFQIWP